MRQKALGGKINKEMGNVVMIEACNLWLELSFKSLMESVWKDFPKQRVIADPVNGQPIHLPNYLMLSKRPRYRNMFFTVNEQLRNFCKLKAFQGFARFV